MTQENDFRAARSPSQKPSAVVRVAQILLRILFVLIMGLGLGIAAYYGIPKLYRDFIEPVQLNTQRITDLEAALDEFESNIRDQTQQTSDRLAAVEGRIVELGESQAEVQADIASLQESQEDQETRLGEIEDTLERIDSLEEELNTTRTELGTLQTDLSGVDAPAQYLARQIQWIRAMELLTRARLWLIQDNLGLAAEDIGKAQAILVEGAEIAPEAEAAQLVLVIERLDLALSNLPAVPVIAADDLEIAWKLMLALTEP